MGFSHRMSRREFVGAGAATGKRIRSVPLRDQNITFA